MFETGATYEFRMIEGGSEVTFRGIVETYEHPLIKLKDSPAMKSVTTDSENDYTISIVEDPDGKPRRGAIINVTSSNFVSAELQD